MKDERKLELVLALLREAIERPSHMTDEQLKQARKFERMFADRVMFNLGFHKAKSTGADDKLVGAYATENLLPMLIGYTEVVQAMAKAPGATKRVGRKKGSYEEWHFAPGYQVVIAFDETGTGGKSLRERIRKAVKDGWLDGKNTSDKTHERRVSLIRQRMEAEEVERLKVLGDNILKFRPRKKARDNKSLS